MEISGNGTVIDLILPILVLIAFCVSGMLYTGGILDGVGLVEAFANCDSALSLVLGPSKFMLEGRADILPARSPP